MSDLFKGVDISWKPFLEGEFQKDYMKKIKNFLLIALKTIKQSTLIQKTFLDP